MLQSVFPKFPARYFALITIILVALLFMLGRGLMDGYAVFLLPLSHDLELSRTALSSVYAVTFMVWGFSGPLIGWAFDRFGAAVVYGCGVLLIAVGQIIAAHAQGLVWLFLGIGLCLGLGVACLGNVVAAGLLRQWFTTRLNTALAIAHAAGIGGILFWAPFSQYLIDLVGWRDGFWLIAGMVTCFLPLCAVVWLIGQSQDQDPDQGEAAVPPRQASATPGVAVKPEAGPSLRQAFADPGFWGLAWVFCVTGIGMHSITLQIPAMLVEAGYSPQAAARAFGLCGVLAPAGMLIFGWLGDRFGRRRIVLLSYGFSVAGAGFAILLAVQPSVILLVLFIALFGFSFGARGPTIATMAARFFAGPQFGRIYGWLTIFMGLGGATGALSGGLWRDLSGSYSAGLMIAMAMMAAGALPFIFLRRMAQA